VDNAELLFFASLVGLLSLLLLADRLRSRWQTRGGLNSIANWTLVSDESLNLPVGTLLMPYELRFIESRLETGETLEGFTHAMFQPCPPDYHTHMIKVYGFPLLIAGTSRRILLFEFYKYTLRRQCTIALDDLESVTPPKPALWGASGPTAFRSRFAGSYRLIFNGPLLNPEALQYEQRLAEYFRVLARRFPAADATDARAA
jgi:hypothetical protein